MEQSKILKQFKELYTDIDNYNSLCYILGTEPFEDLNLCLSWSTPGNREKQPSGKEIIYQKFYDIDIENLMGVPPKILEFLEPFIEAKYKEAINKLREFLREELDDN